MAKIKGFSAVAPEMEPPPITPNGLIAESKARQEKLNQIIAKLDKLELAYTHFAQSVMTDVSYALRQVTGAQMEAMSTNRATIVWDHLSRAEDALKRCEEMATHAGLEKGGEK